MGRGSKTYFDRLSNGEVLPAFHDDLRVNAYMKPEEKQRRLDKRTDIMATILAAYPTTSTSKLAKEFGVSVEYIRQLAQSHGVAKIGRSSGSKEGHQVEKVDAEKNTEPLDGFFYRTKKRPANKHSRPRFDMDLLTDFSIDDEEDFL